MNANKTYVVAVATTNGEDIDTHFVSAKGFAIYEIRPQSPPRFLEYRSVATGPHRSLLIEANLDRLLEKIEIVVVTHLTNSDVEMLRGRGIRVLRAEGRVTTVLRWLLQRHPLLDLFARLDAEEAIHGGDTLANWCVRPGSA